MRVDRYAIHDARARGIGLLRLFATHEATREQFAQAKQAMLAEAQAARPRLRLVVHEETGSRVDWTGDRADASEETSPGPRRFEALPGGRAADSSPPRPERLAGHAPPLEREGRTRIPSSPGTGELPAGGLTAAQLAQFWAWLLEMRERRRDRLAAPWPDAVAFSSFMRWRGRQEEQIDLYEAIIELLHAGMASDFPYLCGVGCRHLEAPFSPQALHRFEDALELWALRHHHSSEEYEVYESTRAALRAIVEGGEPEVW